MQYRGGHSRADKFVRVVRTRGHNTLPSIVGRFFPSRDDEQQREESWGEAFESWLGGEATKRERDIISNIAYYHESNASAASPHRHTSWMTKIQSLRPRREEAHADDAALGALHQGIFDVCAQWSVTAPACRIAEGGDIARLEEWRQALASDPVAQQVMEGNLGADDGDVQRMDDMAEDDGTVTLELPSEGAGVYCARRRRAAVAHADCRRGWHGQVESYRACHGAI